jgi:hypothetical protein
LFLSANPIDASYLEAVKEYKKALDITIRLTIYRDQFKLEQGYEVSLKDIQDLLERFSPDIIHFTGHGSRDGALVFQNSQTDRIERASISAIEELFRIINKKKNIKCVLLSSCYSEDQAEAISRHVDCVIGMSREISIDAANAFTKGFYRGLGNGFDVKSAFELGCNQIELENLNEKELPKLRTETDPSKITFVQEGTETRNIRLYVRDYGTYIEEKTKHFVGRRFVLQRVLEFTQNNSRGYFFILGDPGIGKTAVAAHIVQEKGYIHHFNIRAQGINKTRDFLENVCAQLIIRYKLQYQILPERISHDSGFFTELLRAVSNKLTTDEKVVIVIDALDEVDSTGKQHDANPLYLPPLLPPKTFIIITGRRNAIDNFRIESERDILDIDQNSKENAEDIREYLENQLKISKLRDFTLSQNVTTEGFIELMLRKSQGNFIYLRYVLPEIEQGFYKDLGLEGIPEGLQNYYESHWHLMRGMDETAWFEYKLPVLAALTMVRSPVSVDLIAKFSGVEQHARIRSVIGEWKQFLIEQIFRENDRLVKRYRVYHESFHDFILSKEEVEDERVDLKRTENRIIDSLLPPDYFK